MRRFEDSEIEFTIILVNGEPVKHFRNNGSETWKPLYKEVEKQVTEKPCEHTEDMFTDNGYSKQA